MISNGFEIWGYHIPNKCVSDDDRQYLLKFSNRPVLSVDELWKEIDRVWDKLSLSNQTSLQSQKIGDFYSHLVWILNGLFSAFDYASVSHRNAITKFIRSIPAKKIGDYGGGFCELAIKLSNACPDATIRIIEPFPSQLGKQRISGYPNLSFLNILEKDYDVLIAQDVLEHVEQPIELAASLSDALSSGGFVIFANCFFPYIKCYLPHNFHLRYTFPWVVKAAGLDYVGSVPGASHCQIFKKIGDVDCKKLARRNKHSKFIGPMYNLGYKILNILRNPR